MNRHTWFPSILFVAAFASASGAAFQEVPRNLRVAIAPMDSAGHRTIRLRSFEDAQDRSWMLTVDPARLETSLRPTVGWTPIPDSTARLDTTSWGKLLRTERTSAWKTSGLSHLLTKERGIVLSVDLCPSRKPLDRRLVQRIWNEFRFESKAVPVSFAISGSWIRTHARDLEWLKSQVDSNHIDPTWINHTDHHPYRKGVPDNRNFLFLPGTDPIRETLGAESEMIRRGLVPSVFFRFPGLMENEILFDTILSTGLLPVGSDAWLAKNQKPSAGSIVLIHGNGNEPVGVADFLRLLEKEKPEIRRQTWHLEDLSDELDEECDSIPVQK